MEIVYCVDCGKKLREHDFVRGAAYTRNKHHYCTACRPLEPEAAQAPKPKTTRALPVPRPPRNKSRGALIVAVIAGGLVLAGIATVVAFSGGGAPPADVEAERRESAAREALQRARAYESSNPRDLDAVVQAWQKAWPLCERTSVAKDARQALERAVAARDAARARADLAKKALGPPPAVAWDFETLSRDVFITRDGELYAGVRSPGADQADGLVGKAARFDGRSWIRIDGADVFNAPDLTVCLWIKPTGVKGRQGLLSKRIDSKQSPIVLTLWDGAIGFEAADESTQWPFQLKSLALVKAGEWSHVAVVARSGRNVELYLNGALLQELKIDKPRCRNTDPMFLGREIWNGASAHDGSAFYAGLLDELKLWVQPLSASEIKAHYEAGLSQPRAKER